MARQSQHGQQAETGIRSLYGCRWGADYLLKTLVFDPASGNLTGQIYQVGNLSTDSLFWGRPEDITMARPYYIADASAMSDLGERDS